MCKYTLKLTISCNMHVNISNVNLYIMLVLDYPPTLGLVEMLADSEGGG